MPVLMWTSSQADALLWALLGVVVAWETVLCLAKWAIRLIGRQPLPSGNLMIAILLVS